MTPFELGVAGFVMAVGATVQGSIGFGLNVVAAPFLVLISTELVPGPALVAGFVLVSLVAIRERRSIDIRGLGWALVGRLPGTVAGAFAVAALPASGLAVVLAVLVLVAVVVSAAGWRMAPTRPTLFGAGVASGLMGTIAAIGGPAIALTYQDKAGHEVRGNLSAFFVITTWMSIGALAAVGEFGRTDLGASLALIPGVLIGFVASRWAARVLDRGYTRPAVLGVSAAAAIGALVRYSL